VAPNSCWGCWGTGANGGGEQNALQPGEWLCGAGVEIGEMIVALFERRLVFEANTQAQTESAGYLPIVVQIPSCSWSANSASDGPIVNWPPSGEPSSALAKP